MKKTIPVILLSLSLAAGLCAFTACGDTEESGGSVDNKFASFTTEDEIYGFTAASAATVISAMSGDTETYAAVSGAARTETAYSAASDDDDKIESITDETDYTETVDMLNSYMLLAESLLSEDAYTFVQADVTEEDEGYTDYAYKTVISFSGLAGDSFSYTMYYNETVTEEKTEICAASLSSRSTLEAAPCSSSEHIADDDDDDDPIEHITDYVKIERETVLTGVIVIEGTDYPVSGESKYESETGDESEIEYEQELLVTTGADSYMKIQLETETEDEDGDTESETKYSYSIYEDGTLTEKSTFKYETDTEDGETKLKLSCYDGETCTTTTFYFETGEKDGGKVMKIRIDSSSATETFTVSIAEDGAYLYTALNGSEYKKDR